MVMRPSGVPRGTLRVVEVAEERPLERGHWSGRSDFKSTLYYQLSLMISPPHFLFPEPSIKADM